MRKSLFCLGTVALAATLVLPAGPAAAVETSDSCPEAGSTRLVTTPMPVVGSEDIRLWVYRPTLTRAIVCFDIPFENIGAGAIVVDATGEAPEVIPGVDVGICNITLLDPSDPVRLHLSVNFATGTVCLGFADKNLTLTFSTGSMNLPPSLEIWRDGTGTLLDVVACAREFLLWQLEIGPAVCFNEPGRIL